MEEDKNLKVLLYFRTLTMVDFVFPLELEEHDARKTVVFLNYYHKPKGGLYVK